MRQLAHDYPATNKAIEAVVLRFWQTPRGPQQFLISALEVLQGVLLAAIIAAYTFGSMGDELSFSDNLIVAMRRNMAWAVAGPSARPSRKSMRPRSSRATMARRSAATP